MTPPPDSSQPPTANAALVERALRLADNAFEELYFHCIGYGIYNKLGKPLNCTKINDARDVIKAALTLAATPAPSGAVERKMMEQLMIVSGAIQLKDRAHAAELASLREVIEENSVLLAFLHGAFANRLKPEDAARLTRAHAKNRSALNTTHTPSSPATVAAGEREAADRLALAIDAHDLARATADHIKSKQNDTVEGCAYLELRQALDAYKVARAVGVINRSRATPPAATDDSKDKERLDWLETEDAGCNYGPVDNPHKHHVWVHDTGPEPAIHYYGDTVRQAIDSAMTATKGGAT